MENNRYIPPHARGPINQNPSNSWGPDPSWGNQQPVNQNQINSSWDSPPQNQTGWGNQPQISNESQGWDNAQPSTMQNNWNSAPQSNSSWNSNQKSSLQTKPSYGGWDQSPADESNWNMADIPKKHRSQHHSSTQNNNNSWGKQENTVYENKDSYNRYPKKSYDEEDNSFSKGFSENRYIPPQQQKELPIIKGSSYYSKGCSRWDSLYDNNEESKDGRKARSDKLEKELFTMKITEGINFDKYDDIPVETSGYEIPPSVDVWEKTQLHSHLLDNILLAGFTKLTPVQKHALPIAIKRRDLMACAQTGSGKTAAFLFPIIHWLLTDDITTNPKPKARGRKACPDSLILAPTRELAIQIYNEAQKFTYRTYLRPVVVYGGGSFGQQAAQLEKGCHILIATPGRLNDMIGRGRMSLQNVSILVLDEADRMLDMGFESQIRDIVEQADMPEQGRLTLMFSATFPKEIQRLAGDFLHDYIFLSIGRVGSATDLITQYVELVEDYDKQSSLMSIFPKLNGLTLIFVQTKRNADYLENYLCDQGIQATSIHGDRTQQEREAALDVFRNGQCPVLVATDVAARGLDIPNVLHVINYDLPQNIDDYVHRIGRTGRLGNNGTAISFWNESNRNILEDLFNLLQENHQEVPPWMRSMIDSTGSFGFGGRGGRGGRGRGGNRFGGRDFRRDDSNHFTKEKFSSQSYSSNRGGRGRFQSSNSWNDPPQTDGW